MKFSIFFTSLALYIMTFLQESHPIIQLVLLWIFANLMTLAIAYFLNKPEYVLGKNEHGKIKPLSLFLNLPWLVFTWTCFKLQIILSKEDFSNQIYGTNIWISRRPTNSDDLSQFDLIIDLTAEFPCDRFKGQYLSYPNLDGHILNSLPNKLTIDKEQRTLIHCANGHGRSALFTSLLMVELNYSKKPEDSLQSIFKSRPLALPNKTQLKWLKNQNQPLEAT